MSNAGAAPRAAVSVTSARAEASRKNGAKSRGPKTPEGKARSAQNALKHGMRAEKHIVLPDEDAGEFAALEAALLAELAPVGALQTVLARRVAVAAWRLVRADRIEAELFEERSWGADPNLGLALIRDGNGTRSFETLLRYRGAAMAEFWRALRTLKALQAEQAATMQLRAVAAEPAPVPMVAPVPARSGANAGHDEGRCKVRRTPNEPDAAPRPATPEPARQRRIGPETRLYRAEPRRQPNAPEPARSLHEAAAPWGPSEPEARGNSGGITPPAAPHRLGPQRRGRVSGDLPSGHVDRASG